jgi:hypothetical protein
MKAQNTKTGFNEGLLLQRQLDSLRCELKALSKFNQFNETWHEKTRLLERLDRLFLLHCKNNDLDLSKFGRLC